MLEFQNIMMATYITMALQNSWRTMPVLARNSGATIIGGCCGTMPEHLELMRQALDTRPRGAAPSLQEIVLALGPFTSESDGTDDKTPISPSQTQ